VVHRCPQGIPKENRERWSRAVYNILSQTLGNRCVFYKNIVYDITIKNYSCPIVKELYGRLFSENYYNGTL
jgi:hypothetical protein